MSFFFSTLAGAENTVDSFEDGSNTDSWYAWGGGTLMSAEDTSGLAYSAKDGAYTSRLDGARGTSVKGSADINENLPNYPTMGAHFEYYARFTGTPDDPIVCYWCHPDSGSTATDSWEYRLNGGLGDTELEANSSGSEGDTSFDSTAVSYSQDEWYRVEVFYNTGTTTHIVEVYLYDSAGTQLANDVADPADGGDGTWDSSDNYYYETPSIAFLGGSGTQGVVDHARLR